MDQKTSLLCHAKLQQLPDVLRRRIRGQEQVLPRVVSILQHGELGLSSRQRPKGSFLFLGPTGVGKTELTLTFTEFLLGDGKTFRFDMSEYQTQESVGILLGGRLGERGVLGLRYDESGGSGTLLFDEIEKAHPRVLDLFLQILDAGRVSLANGETLDLTGFYVVCTSNIGSTEIMGMQHCPFTTLERHVKAKAQQSLRPELFARITEVLVFNRLSYETQLELAALMLEAELSALSAKGYGLTPDKSVLSFLVLKGFHARLGARPMRGAVEKYVRDALANDLLTGGNGCGDLGFDPLLNALSLRGNAVLQSRRWNPPYGFTVSPSAAASLR